MYQHKYMNIDLGSGRVQLETVDQKTTRQFLGGSGLSAHTLFSGTDGSIDPLGPDNLLIFNTGPFTGTKIPSTGRHSVAAKSPLTGIWAESDVGGRWGTMLKKTGIDGIVFKGRSAEPVYVFITQEGVQIKSASHLWGKNTHDTTAMLKKQLGKKVQVSCIGQAGENKVLLSSIMHDGKDGRAAGRCGLGAVMGAKNLKAVAVLGNKEIPIHDPEGLEKKIQNMVSTIKDRASFLGCYGTSGGLTSLEASGDLPIKNFSQGQWSKARNLTGEEMAKTVLKGRFACGACPVGCGRKISITQGPYAGVDGAGPEYETMASFGSYCLVDRLDAVCQANALCNQYGMDTISVGAAIAFAMEAYEKGHISPVDSDGINLTWGNHEAMIHMIRLIGENKGLGKLLGQGVKKASEILGSQSQSYAIHVKGLELPAHDPRAYFSTGLSYATSNRGGCHLAGLTHGVESSVTVPELGILRPMERFSNQGKGPMVAKMQDLMGIFDSLKICKFLLYADISVTDLLECLNLVTGWQMDIKTFLAAGTRMFNLKRMYNIACGVTGADDRLPDRLTQEPLNEGGTKGHCPDIRAMLREYYAFRRWDDNGVPQKALLHELDIESIN